MDGMEQQILLEYEGFLAYVKEGLTLSSAEVLNEDQEQFQRLLDRRKEKIAAIMELEARLEAPSLAFLEKRTALLEETLVWSKKVDEAFQESFNKLQAQIQKVRVGREGNRAYYRRPSQAEGHFVDAKK